MNLPVPYILEHLIPAVEKLRDHALAIAEANRDDVEGIPPLYQESARNLLHYLALRQSDNRDLQQDLALLGLTRLGRCEAHTLGSIDAVLTALRALAGRDPHPEDSPGAVNIKTGSMLLNAHAQALLGAASGNHDTRIMVTLPSEAATDPDLMRELLAAGMDIARVNCAHDDADAWLAMIRHLREAEQALGRKCRIYADLAGPKLRTGDIKPVGRLTEFKTQRDLWGRVTAPARIWLTPRSHPETPTLPVDTVLPVDDGLLAAVHASDTLDVDDTRGSRRHLTIKERFGGSWLAHCHQRAFIGDGAACHLYRRDALLMEGSVGPLPEVTQPLVLNEGDTLHLVRGDRLGTQARHDEAGRLLEPATIPCTLDAVFDSARPGEPIWFDDGKIGGVIRANADGVIAIEITQAASQGSKLRAEKGINLPETELGIPALTDKDLADLAALAPHVDMIGLSFVRAPEDVQNLQQRIRAIGAEHLGMVLKIETRQAFDNLPMILLASLHQPPVGVMVARGDLAVEVGFERLSEVQEEILWLCEAAHVPVIWATQVLETMAKRGVPSRAEVSDAALAVRAECVMLNKGPYIVDTVRFLNGVLERMRGHMSKRRPMMRRLAVSSIPARSVQ